MNLPPHLNQDYFGQAIKEHFDKVLWLETENSKYMDIVERLNNEVAYLEWKNAELQSECEGLAAAFSSAESQYEELKAQNERLMAYDASIVPTLFQHSLGALQTHTDALQRVIEELRLGLNVNNLQAEIDKSE